MISLPMRSYMRIFQMSIKHYLGISAVVAILLAIIAAGIDPKVMQTPTHAYIANSGNDSIVVCAIDPATNLHGHLINCKTTEIKSKDATVPTKIAILDSTILIASKVVDKRPHIVSGTLAKGLIAAPPSTEFPLSADWLVQFNPAKEGEAYASYDKIIHICDYQASTCKSSGANDIFHQSATDIAFYSFADKQYAYIANGRETPSTPSATIIRCLVDGSGYLSECEDSSGNQNDTTGTNIFNSAWGIRIVTVGTQTYAYVAQYKANAIGICNVTSEGIFNNCRNQSIDAAPASIDVGSFDGSPLLYISDFKNNEIVLATIDEATGELSYTAQNLDGLLNKPIGITVY
jgi:hypothetical protein